MVLVSIMCLFMFVGRLHAQSVEEKIIYFAEKQNVNPQLALAIAQCEGGLGEAKKNPNSSATGPFQMIKSTWQSTTKRMGWVEGTDVWDVHLNIVAGIWLLKNDGVRHWEESRSCWSKIV